MNSNSTHTISDHGLLLTVNNRLARELKRRFAHKQIAAGLKAWKTPEILAWNNWLLGQHTVLIETGFTHRALLNPHQERILWEQAVQESRTGAALLRPGAAAKTARQAWRILHDWRLAPETLDDHPDPETRLFAQWARRFAQLCEQARSISPSELGALLIGALREGLIAAPEHIQLSGFDNLTPLQELILDTLRDAGSEVVLEREPARSGRATRVVFSDRQTEYLAAAAWAGQTLARHPRARLAIVSPRLEDDRAGLERALAQALDPGGFLSADPGPAGYNISLGKPLNAYPLIADLILAMRLALEAPLHLNEIGRLLRSPFIAGQGVEWQSRAALDRHLRERGQPTLRPDELLRRARAIDAQHPAACPELIKRLQALQDLLGQLPTQDSPNAWSGHLLRLIATLGWPGDRSLDSSEHQQLDRVRLLISEFSTLARVRSAFRLSQAITYLRRLCEETEFQPKRPDAPIQVLGMLESAGLAFDGLWLLGMHDRAWPPPPSPNPLLPASLQREKNMPHASAERELVFARRVLDRLLRSAGEAFISHARQEEEQELRPSALIRDLAQSLPAELGLALTNPTYQAATAGGRSSDPLEIPTQVAATAIPAGGSALLADQAACPFRAVGHFRLGARALPEPTQAPDARLLGHMVHQMLERVWSTLQDSTTLKNTSSSDLLRLLDRAAENTLNDLGRARPDLYHGAFRELEKTRLRALIADWLRYESRRKQAFRVIAREKRSDIALAGLPLRVRIDRIDQLEDGSQVIIDYKTGARVSVEGWTDVRPSEPQVPLYCISQPGVSAGILAQVNRAKMRMHGIARVDGIAPDLQSLSQEEAHTTWDMLVGDWRTRLEHLAQEILAGLAQVQPQHSDSCRYCDLQPLCRVEYRAGPEEEAEA